VRFREEYKTGTKVEFIIVKSHFQFGFISVYPLPAKMNRKFIFAFCVILLISAVVSKAQAQEDGEYESEGMNITRFNVFLYIAV
jgi:hypothetical protein